MAPPDVSVSAEGSIEVSRAAIQLSNSSQAAIEIPMAPLASDLFIEEIANDRIASAEPEARQPIVVEAIPAPPDEILRAAPYTAPDYSLSMFPSDMVYQEMVVRAERPAVYVRHPIAAVGAMILAASVIGAAVFGIMTAGGVGDEIVQWVHRIWYMLHGV